MGREVRSSVAEATANERKAETCGAVLVVVPVVEGKGGKGVEGVHSHIEEGRSWCHFFFLFLKKKKKESFPSVPSFVIPYSALLFLLPTKF